MLIGISIPVGMACISVGMGVYLYCNRGGLYW